MERNGALPGPTTVLRVHIYSVGNALRSESLVCGAHVLAHPVFIVRQRLHPLPKPEALKRARGTNKKEKKKSFILKMLRSRSPVVETEEKDCEKQIRNHGRAHGWIHINFGGRVFFPLTLYTRDLHEPSLAIEEHLSGSPPHSTGTWLFSYLVLVNA